MRSLCPYLGIALSGYVKFMELSFLACNPGIMVPTSQGFGEG